jgi:hypothetical protein
MQYHQTILMIKVFWHFYYLHLINYRLKTRLDLYNLPSGKQLNRYGKRGVASL